MLERIIKVIVLALLICAVVFALVVGGIYAYMVWSWEKHQDSLEKTPEAVGLSEWESDTSPKITLHIADAGGSYCTIAEKEYRVLFISKSKYKNIKFYEMIGEWKSVVCDDGTVIYNGIEANEPTFLFDVTGFEYQDTKFIVYVQPWKFDIFEGEVYKITFVKK